MGAFHSTPFIVTDDPQESKMTTPQPTHTATPIGTSRSEAFIPDESPPYEDPIDLRYPLHWSIAHFEDTIKVKTSDDESESDYDCRSCPRPQSTTKPRARAASTYLPSSDERALQNAQDELKPLGMRLSIGVASRIRHYPGTSPVYFQVWISGRSDWKKDHERVVETIRKNFGHLESHEVYKKPVIRYVQNYPDWTYEAEDTDY